MAEKCFKLCKLFSQTNINPVIVNRRGVKNYLSRQLVAIKHRQTKYFQDLSEEEYNELNKRSNFIEWNYSSEIFAFGKRLNEEFRSETLLQAFTHRSYIVKEELKLKELGVENPQVDFKDNAELAEEGENLISHYVPRYVSHFFPRFPLEGIQNIHDYLLSDEVLGNISKNLGTTFLILSADYPVEVPTYAKTFKAIVGALNKCQGVNRTNLFVRDFVVTQLAGKDVNDFLQINSYQEVLNDILKRAGKQAFEPRIICQSSVNTVFANYHIGLYLDKQLIGHCSGESIDIAVEMASLDALKRMFHTTDSHNPISYDLVKIPEKISNIKLSEWNEAAFEKSSLQRSA